jgi:hypothetical protein
LEQEEAMELQPLMVPVVVAAVLDLEEPFSFKAMASSQSWMLYKFLTITRRPDLEALRTQLILI